MYKKTKYKKYLDNPQYTNLQKNIISSQNTV